jgi:hypothetical protein
MPLLDVGKGLAAEPTVVVDRLGIAMVDGDVLLTRHMVATFPFRVRVRQIIWDFVPEDLSPRPDP